MPEHLFSPGYKHLQGMEAQNQERAPRIFLVWSLRAFQFLPKEEHVIITREYWALEKLS